MKLAFGVDEATELTDLLEDHLRSSAHELTIIVKNEPWPIVAKKVARSLQAGESEFGILLCYTGTGVALAANKFYGIRAALCASKEVAEGARRYNDANIVALGLLGLDLPKAKEIVDTFLRTPVDINELPTIGLLDESEIFQTNH